MFTSLTVHNNQAGLALPQASGKTPAVGCPRRGPFGYPMPEEGLPVTLHSMQADPRPQRPDFHQGVGQPLQPEDLLPKVVHLSRAGGVAKPPSIGQNINLVVPISEPVKRWVLVEELQVERLMGFDFHTARGELETGPPHRSTLDARVYLPAPRHVPAQGVVVCNGLAVRENGGLPLNELHRHSPGCPLSCLCSLGQGVPDWPPHGPQNPALGVLLDHRPSCPAEVANWLHRAGSIHKDLALHCKGSASHTGVLICVSGYILFFLQLQC